MSLQPIIVFDSGIGGLSIYRPLRHSLPAANVIYIADQQYFPYGDKTEVWIKARFVTLSMQFTALHPLLVVIACNTATLNAVTYLRSILSCPVVGVEPVIKPLSGYQRALALMTTVSATSVSTAKLLKQYGPHVRVFTPQGLASAIEYNDYDQVKKSIHEIKELVRKYQIEAIGLSCTHYALIINEFKRQIPGVVFIDPSPAVVKEVHRVLKSSPV
ncbi:MAG: aspartate/glutamate racemase family protein [bacterium]